MSGGVHTHQIEVRFGDCDPAGIVYFPRFFDLFHQAMESWFAAELAVDYAHVVMTRQIGFPAVHTEADFSRPCAFGEALEVQLRVTEIGRTSLSLGYEIRGASDAATLGPRVKGATVVAAFDLDPASASFRRAIEIPDDLRAAIERFGLS